MLWIIICPQGFDAVGDDNIDDVDGFDDDIDDHSGLVAKVD